MKKIWAYTLPKFALSILTLLLWFGLQAHVQLHNHESYEHCAACAAAHHYISAHTPEYSGQEEVLGFTASTAVTPASFELISRADSRAPPLFINS